MNKLNNQKGSILLITTVILYALILLSIAFASANFNELNYARRYQRSINAFWLAEAGSNMFMTNTSMLNSSFAKDIEYGGGVIHLTRDDSKPMVRLITSTGTFQGVERKVQISYPANIPEVYKNTLSSKKNILINGNKTSLIINDKAHISGQMFNTSKHPNVFFEDLQQNLDSSVTTLTYPDQQKTEFDSNDDFETFTKYNKSLLNSYPADQILHVKADQSYVINNSSPLAGKKIVYIEGDAGGGNVLIQTSGFLQKDQDITIISTGTVTFNQASYQIPNSQLNIIAWSGYNETVSAPSSHRGIIYTHGTATFDKIYDTSTTSGGVIADGGIVFGEVWSTKVFNYADMTKNGYYPPGFERLTGAGMNSMAAEPNAWKEIFN